MTRPPSSAAAGAPPPAARLRVDWPACQARGLCSEVAPELIELDRWGYPVTPAEVAPELTRHAKAAVAVCPHRALRWVDA